MFLIIKEREHYTEVFVRVSRAIILLGVCSYKYYCFVILFGGVVDGVKVSFVGVVAVVQLYFISESSCGNFLLYPLLYKMTKRLQMVKYNSVLLLTTLIMFVCQKCVTGQGIF